MCLQLVGTGKDALPGKVKKKEMQGAKSLPRTANEKKKDTLFLYCIGVYPVNRFLLFSHTGKERSALSVRYQRTELFMS